MVHSSGRVNLCRFPGSGRVTVGLDDHNNGGESDEEDEEPGNDNKAQNQEEHDIAEEGPEVDDNELDG